MEYPLPLRRSSTTGDVTLAWELRGADDAPVLVLAHGFSGSAADFDQHTEALVGEGFRVLTLDHRGHGRSGRSQTYSFTAIAEDLAQLIATEIGRPVHLLGHSMGGRVALELVLAHPKLVASLILMDTSAWSFGPDDPEVRAGLVRFVDAYDPADGLPADLGTGPDEALMVSVAEPAFLSARREVQKLFDPVAFKVLGRALFTCPSLKDRLRELDLPVTVIVGEHDDTLAAQAPELATLTRGRLEVIAGGYHSPQITHQAEWRAAVTAHLRCVV